MVDPQPSSTDTAVFSDIGAVILDFDGVVADSEVISLATLRGALAEFGVTLSADAVRERFLGRSLASIAAFVEEHSPSQNADGFAETWQTTLYAQFRADLKPVPSVLPLLEHLDRAGMPYCVASSSSFERINVALEAMGLAGRFDDIFSAQQVARGKPAPDLFLLASQQLGLAPESFLVIEDSPFGIEAAKAAGMRSVGFVGGTHLHGIQKSHAMALSAKGAEAIIDTHEHLVRMGLAQGASNG